MKTVYLIDANSIIHRCFHALPPLTASDGRPAQALYGLASVLIKLFREGEPGSRNAVAPAFGGRNPKGDSEASALLPPEDAAFSLPGKPAYAAACFDRPEPTFREAEYKEYKAHRPPTPDALISQIIEAHALFEKFGIATFEGAGYEADDFIAGFAKKFGNRDGVNVVILTGDMDTLQLVKDGDVAVRAFKKGISDTILYDEAAVKERYGLEPRQLADYKAFVGDASDNIKGVPGIGPKTAQELLQRFGALEAIYAHLDQLSERARAILEAARAQAALSKKLVTLETPGSVAAVSLEDLSVRFKQEDASEYLSSLGFSSLVARLEGRNGAKPAKKEKEKPPRTAQQGMF